LQDVIVVGAGPAGNNAALSLASKGYGVTVIDSRENIGDKLCTGLVGEECFRRHPIDPALVYREINAASVIAPSGEVVRFETPLPVARVVNRVAYVSSFADRAREAGAEYLLGRRVVDLEQHKDWISVTTDDGSIKARTLVLAAGFGSQLNRQLGLGEPSDYVVGIQALVRTENIDEIEVYLGRDIAPGFFAWLVPTEPGIALAGLLVRKNAPEKFVSFISAREAEGKITETVNKPVCWGIPLRPLRKTYTDRVLVVGDAAGQVKPTTGGGIFYSLLASEVASGALHQALSEDKLSANHLGVYQKEWKNLLSTELEVGYSARRMFEYLGDSHISSLIHQASNNGFIAELADSPEVSFDWHSSMIGKIAGHPTLGGVLRLVNPLLARMAKSPEPAGMFFPDQLVAVESEVTMAETGTPV
jgi:geranylgeranyl reductase family protein|tara:strand:- start:186769 stop:188022 length:1254 start_codon:yes stop_codon:yes gene_type:complete